MGLTYNGTIYRPPVEAETFLLPITEGCSHNACRFCSMYKDVPFCMVDLDQAEEYLQEASLSYRANGRELSRVYLVGADPFVLSANRLEQVAELIHKYIPECRVITMYAAVRNIMNKSDEDLRRIKAMGIDDLYVGIESAREEVLEHLNKGNTAANAREQVLRLNAAGISHMDMLMLGAAGEGEAEKSALAAAALENETRPKMILINSMSLFPETDLYDDVQKGKFKTAGEKEILIEEKIFVENLKLPETYFWAAHSLDVVRMAGYLCEDQQKMVQLLEHTITNLDEERLREHFQREKMSI